MSEHAKKLRDHLYVLDSLTSLCKRMNLFQAADPGVDVNAKCAELSEACTRTDLLIKLGKSLISKSEVSWQF